MLDNSYSSIVFNKSPLMHKALVLNCLKTSNPAVNYSW